MNDKGLLLVVSGPSGAGKGTVCNEYMKNYSDCSLSVSATTRKPREGEKEGVNYFYLSEKEFLEKEKNGGFLESAVFCSNHYGTPKEEVMKMIESGTDVILEIEVQGAMQVRKRYPESVLVFVMPPSKEELEKRLIGRKTETMDVIEGRLRRSKEEYKFIEKYDYVLWNDDVSSAVKRLRAVIEAEKCLVKRNYTYIQKEFM